MLQRRKSSDGSAAIDKLFLANNVVSLLGHPPLLVRLQTNTTFGKTSNKHHFW
jgi:hypothetical protein